MDDDERCGDFSGVTDLAEGPQESPSLSALCCPRALRCEKALRAVFDPDRAITWRCLVALCCLAALSSFAVSASADEVRGTRSEELRETAHRVDVSFDRGHALLRVRRTFHNGFARHDQAVVELDAPYGAVAVGLATRGSLRGQPHWFRGELLEAEAAAARYRELTGYGGYYPKDPALLSWRHQGRLALQVFPCPPNEDKQIEYTFSVPARYEHGEYHIDLPRMGTQERAAEVFVRPKHSADQVLVDGAAVPPQEALPTPGAHEALTVSLAPRWLPAFGGRLASIPLSERALTSWSVELGPSISAVPDDPYVVVVLDTSLSLDEWAVSGQLSAAEAYLSHFGKGHVRVLSFDRDVHSVHTHWVSPRAAIEDLATLQPARRNGSEVGRALEEAARIALRSPRGASRRIVLMTDARTRQSLQSEQLEAITRRTSALIHVGVIGGFGVGVEPDNAHPWSAIARGTGGLLWQASVSGSPEDAEQMTVAMEEWARPKRLFNARLSADGVPGEELEPPRTLREGDAITFHDLTDKSVAWVKLQGELWSRPMTRTFVPSRAHARREAAHVFGTNLYQQLSEADMMKLARLGGAVSPVTSYLAIEPGVRPSTEGLDWSGVGLMGIGMGGGGRGEGIGLGSIGVRDAFDRYEFLRSKLAAVWAECGGASGTATVVIETTLYEIVDVSVSVAPSKRTEALRSCMKRGSWDLLLPPRFDKEWQRWKVEL